MQSVWRRGYLHASPPSSPMIRLLPMGELDRDMLGTSTLASFKSNLDCGSNLHSFPMLGGVSPAVVTSLFGISNGLLSSV